MSGVAAAGVLPAAAVSAARTAVSVAGAAYKDGAVGFRFREGSDCVGVRLARAKGGRVLSGADDVAVLTLDALVAVEDAQPLKTSKPSKPKSASILCGMATLVKLCETASFVFHSLECGQEIPHALDKLSRGQYRDVLVPRPIMAHIEGDKQRTLMLNGGDEDRQILAIGQTCELGHFY